MGNLLINNVKSGFEPYKNKIELDQHGYTICKNFFSPDVVIKLRNEAERVFNIQFTNFKYEGSFQENMIRLFEEHEDIFINCGKIIQTGLIDLYRISVDELLRRKLVDCGIRIPNMCTRPVLYFNHPKLAKKEIYYKTPPHQDWPSMESSMNSLVVWVPLVDVNKENGSIILYPGSHKLGVLPFNSNEGFAQVEIPKDIQPIQPELKVGDICIFSTLLVHESGDITNDTIRWSCHFRYTDLLEQDFINRGYPCLYNYVPVTKQNK